MSKILEHFLLFVDGEIGISAFVETLFSIVSIKSCGNFANAESKYAL